MQQMQWLLCFGTVVALCYICLSRKISYKDKAQFTNFLVFYQRFFVETFALLNKQRAHIKLHFRFDLIVIFFSNCTHLFLLFLFQDIDEEKIESIRLPESLETCIYQQDIVLWTWSSILIVCAFQAFAWLCMCEWMCELNACVRACACMYVWLRAR